MLLQKEMNILRICAYYKPAHVYGGPIHSIHNHSLALAQKGHQITTYTTNANGQVDLEIPEEQPTMLDGLPIYYFPRWWFGRERKSSNIFFSPSLGMALKNIKSGDFDLLLLHASFCDPARKAASLSLRTSLPYIYYTHGGFEPWALRHKFLKKRIYMALVEKRVLNRAAGIVVCNDAEKAELERLGIKTPIRRIPWGVDLPKDVGLPTRRDLGDIFPKLERQRFLLFLSRLHPKKGLDLLLPVFAQLAPDFPDWLLVIAGPDEMGLKASLEQYASQSGLNQKILFPGLVTGERKAALLAHADIFVLPSYSEGFPVVVAEALAFGRPIILTKTCYIPEVAQWGAGLEIPPEREPLAEALRSLMSDEAKRRQCACNAMKLGPQHFAWDAVAQQSLAFFREVIRCHSSN